MWFTKISVLVAVSRTPPFCLSLISRSQASETPPSIPVRQDASGPSGMHLQLVGVLNVYLSLSLPIGETLCLGEPFNAALYLPGGGGNVVRG